MIQQHLKTQKRNPNPAILVKKLRKLPPSMAANFPHLSTIGLSCTFSTESKRWKHPASKSLVDKSQYKLKVIESSTKFLRNQVFNPCPSRQTTPVLNHQ
jgi:hypothetical protein